MKLRKAKDLSERSNMKTCFSKEITGRLIALGLSVVVGITSTLPTTAMDVFADPVTYASYTKNQADGVAVYEAVKSELESIDYLNDPTIQSMLGPTRYTSTEKLNKKTEIFKRDGIPFAEITDEMAIAELNKDNLEAISFKEAFAEVQADLEVIIPNIVRNSNTGYTGNDTTYFTEIILDNKEKFMLGLTYLYRLYDFNIGDVNIKDKLLEDSSYFGIDCDLVMWLITLGGSGGDSLKIANNLTTFQTYFKGRVTNSTSVTAFIEAELQKNAGLTANEWFNNASEALIIEESSQEMPDAVWRLYDKLKSDSGFSRYILPLLNVSENTIYVISNPATITIGPVDTYVDRSIQESNPAAYQTEVESFTQELKNNSASQVAFLDLWHRIAKDDKGGRLQSNRLVIDALRVKKGNNGTASAEWSVKFGDAASRGVSEFFTPMNLYASYVSANAQAEGTGVRYFMSKAISNDGLCTYTHELTHLLVESVFMNGYTARQGLEGEFFPRGLYESFWSTDPIMNLNLVYEYSDGSGRIYNASPERFQDAEDLQEFTQGMMDVLYTLDYMEAQSVLQKDTAAKQKWYHKMTQTVDTRTRFNQGDANAVHTVDTIVEITEAEAAALSTIDDLIEQNIVASRYEIDGLYTTGTAASNGYHTVPLFTSNYSVGQNDNGVSGDIMTRRQAHELLAEYGYYDGMVPYISNQYLAEAQSAAAVLSDTFIFNKIFGSDYTDMKAFKKAMFERRADRLDELKPISITYDNKVTQITSGSQLQQLMNEAVAYDLQNVTTSSYGWPNIRAQNTKVELLKRAVYSAYLEVTDDFQTSIYGEKVLPTETPTPTETPVTTPTPIETPVTTPTPIETPVTTPTPIETPVVTTVPTETPNPNDSSRDIPIAVLTPTAGDYETDGGASEGPARLVLDGNGNTLWHTDWYGTSRDNHWIQFELSEDYVVDGLRYWPRQGGNTNGIITEYKILVSDDGEIFEPVKSGTWDPNRDWKIATFDGVQAKYVRLVAVNATTDNDYVFASAGEIRLTGERVPEPAPDDSSRDIPIAVLTPTAGDYETDGGALEGPAGLVLDGNGNTLWHTDWYGTSRDNHWIQFELSEDYMVDGLRYWPRQGGNTNGIITEYQILVSDDGKNFEPVKSGTWDPNRDWKIATFDGVQAKYVRLVAVNATTDNDYVFASAGEIRLTGSKISEVTPEPTPEPTETPEPTPTPIGTLVPEGSNISAYTNIAPDANSVTTNGNDTSSNGKEHLTDKNTNTIYQFHNGRLTEEKEVVLMYDEAKKIDGVRIVFEKKDNDSEANYQFEYSILARNGDGEYDTIVSHAIGNRTTAYAQGYQFAENEYTEVKIIMHDCYSDLYQDAGHGWPSIAEFEIYGIDVNATPTPAPLSGFDNIADEADITTTGTEHSTAGSANLVDEKYGTLYKFHDAAMTSEKEVVLTYDEVRKMDAFKIVFEHAGETDTVDFLFEYSILARIGDGEYVTIADHVTANRTDDFEQTYKFDEAIYSEVKIVMHSCTTYNGTSNGYPAIAEFEIYGEELPLDGNYNREVDVTIAVGETLEITGILAAGPTVTGIVNAEVPTYTVVGGDRNAEYPIPSGRYLITNNSHMITNNTVDGSPNGLGMQAVNYTDNNLSGSLWNFKQVDGGYTIQDANGKYLNFANVNGSQCDVVLTDTPQTLRIVATSGNGYGITDGTHYFNNFNAVNTKVVGWNSNDNNWYFYQAEENVTITGLTEGTTQIVVNRTAYNITVTDNSTAAEFEPKDIVVDFGLPVEITYAPWSKVQINADEEEQSVQLLTGTNVGKADYGTVDVERETDNDGNLSGWKITYIPTSVLQTIDHVTVYGDENGDGNHNVEYTFAVYPATSVYYEEGFMDYGTDDWGTTISKGTGTQALQVLTEEVVNNYGYDEKYSLEASGPSNGTEAVSNQAGNMTSFDFTGTGVDIYANCTPDTGIASILIREKTTDGTTGAIKKLMILNTKMANGYSDATSAQAVNAYNIPIASVKELEHGAYTVKIQHSSTAEDSKILKLDGFRVYGTLADSSVFEVHDEADPNFIEMRNVVLNSLELDEVLAIPTPTEVPIPAILDTANMTVTVSGTSETSTTGENAANVTSNDIKAEIFDDNNTTYWTSNYVNRIAVGNPHLTIDLGAVYELSQVDYTPRWDSSAHWMCTGAIKKLVVEVSEDNSTWQTITTEGGMDISGKIESSNAAEFPVAFKFDAVRAKYVRISGLESEYWNGDNTVINVADLNIYGTEPASTSVPVESIYAEDIAAGLTQVLNSSEKGGIIITDPSSNLYTSDFAKDLLDNGPKNELFLYKDQTLIFKLSAGLENVQLGLKAVNGLVSLEAMQKEGNEAYAEMATIPNLLITSTDMYYKVGNIDSDTTFMITNTGDSILSVTNLKYFNAVNSVSVFSGYEVADFQKLMLSYGFKSSEVPEITDKPEATPSVTPEPTQTPQDPLTNPFIDVDEKEFYYEAVLWAADKEITSGLTADTFGPNNDCTRGQVVTFLWRTAGCPEPSVMKTTFEDVASDEYYYKAVLWATEKGITTGYNAKTFGSDDIVTRGQFVTFLWRFESEPEANVQECQFTDVKANEYYYEAVLWAVENGVTNGYKDNLFAPDISCTRGQVVTFLYRTK